MMCRYDWDLSLYPNQEKIYKRAFRHIWEAYREELTLVNPEPSKLSLEEAAMTDEEALRAEAGRREIARQSEPRHTKEIS